MSYTFTSVFDEMPADGAECLTLTEEGYVTINTYRPSPKGARARRCNAEEGNPCSWFDGSDRGYIVAWAALPEASRDEHSAHIRRFEAARPGGGGLPVA